MRTKRERITRLYLPGRPVGPPLSGGTKDSIRFFPTRDVSSPSPLHHPAPPRARARSEGSSVCVPPECVPCARREREPWVGQPAAHGNPRRLGFLTKHPRGYAPVLRILHHCFIIFSLLVVLRARSFSCILLTRRPPIFRDTAGPYGYFDWFHGFVEIPSAGRKIVTMTLYHDDRYTWSSLRENLNLAVIFFFYYIEVILLLNVIRNCTKRM